MPIICLAIIADLTNRPQDSNGGKTKLIECKKYMIKIDKYTLKCPKGHIKRTALYEIKGYEVFYGLNIKGSL